MRRLWFLTILLLSFRLGAQTLQVDAQHHNFGKLSSNTKATHAFRVSNRGNKDLVISGLHSSCGCTSVLLGRTTLSPGESTNIEATFNPGGSVGRAEKTIQVASNDTDHPTITLSIVAEVIRDLYVDPSSAMFFETVRRGGTRELTLHLKSDLGPVRVDAIDVSSTPYLSNTFRVEGDMVTLKLNFNPAKAPIGQLQGKGSFLVKTSQPNTTSLVIPVVWSMARVFVVTPNRIGTQMVGGQDQRVTVRISRVDGKSFQILEVFGETAASKTPNIEIRLPKTRTGRTLEIELFISPGPTPGLHRNNVTIKTDDPDEPSIAVPVNVLVVARPVSDAKSIM